MKKWIRRYVEMCAEKKGNVAENYMRAGDMLTWDDIIAKLAKREGLSKK